MWSNRCVIWCTAVIQQVQAKLDRNPYSVDPVYTTGLHALGIFEELAAIYSKVRRRAFTFSSST